MKDLGICTGLRRLQIQLHLKDLAKQESLPLSSKWTPMTIKELILNWNVDQILLCNNLRELVLRSDPWDICVPGSDRGKAEEDMERALHDLADWIGEHFAAAHKRALEIKAIW